MEKFKTLKSIVCPVPLSNVDTDMIIPAQYLTSTSREGYGENVFRRMRDENPEFALNKAKYESAEILLADDNFGCGSSREHAVWAISAWGFKVVIAKSFADIFFSNSAKNGLLLISLPDEVVDSLLKQAEEESLEITVNLEEQYVELPDGVRHSFDYDSFRKHCLLHGLDDIDYILSLKQQVNEFRKNQFNASN
jgi:3-isopropylmalate/(R)-2-methylmalate dehydratase small subunit